MKHLNMHNFLIIMYTALTVVILFNFFLVVKRENQIIKQQQTLIQRIDTLQKEVTLMNQYLYNQFVTDSNETINWQFKK